MGFWWSKVRQWLGAEGGQDLSEYCLLLALIVLIAAGIFLKVSGGVQALWTAANSTLANSPGSSAVTSTARTGR